jgi:hypothetical protein
MKLIETKTLGTAAASIEFTSIPQTFTDLVILVSGRTTGAGVSQDLFARFNGDSGANYTMRRLIGNGASASSDSNTADGVVRLGQVCASGATANTFGNTASYIPNYTGSTSKSVSSDSVLENNATTAFQFIIAGIYTPTTAISSVTLLSFDNFAIGSTASLYGVLKGSDGITTAS